MGRLSNQGLVLVDTVKARFLAAVEDWFLGGKEPTDQPCRGIPQLCDGVASVCSLAHCHAAFGREEHGRVWGDCACYWKSFLSFFFWFVYLHLFML